MIKIVDENIYRIDMMNYQVNEIFSLASEVSHPEELAFLFYKEDQFVGACSMLDILENRMPIPMFIQKNGNGYKGIDLYGRTDMLELEEQLFPLARKLFFESPYTNDDEYRVLAVFDEAGTCQFVLRYEYNRIYGEKSEGTVYDEFHDLDTLDYYDDTLLNRFQTIICYEYNEYTDFLMSYILKQGLSQKVICLDEKMKYGWEDPLQTSLESSQIAYCENQSMILEIKEQLGQIMFITSDYMNEYGLVPCFLSGVYSSLAVIKSLCWCGKVERLGELHEDKTILLLNFDIAGSGLVDIMKFTAYYCELAQKRGLVPVVDYHDRKGQFSLQKDENMWTLFFEQVSDIPVEEARNSAFVISGEVNSMRLVDWEMNPYIYEEDYRLWNQVIPTNADNILKKNIHPKHTLLQAAKEQLPKELNGENRILGIIARGSDYRKEALEARVSGDYVRNKDIQELISEIKQKLSEEAYDYLYLATEDAEYFELITNEFKDKVIFHQQERVRMDTEEKQGLLLTDLLKSEKPTIQTERYVCILTALTGCDKLISSMNCGAYLAGLSQCFKI